MTTVYTDFKMLRPYSTYLMILLHEPLVRLHAVAGLCKNFNCPPSYVLTFHMFLLKGSLL